MPPIVSVTRYRLRKGDIIAIVAASSTVTTFRASFRILYDDGSDDELVVPDTATGSARTQEFFRSETRAKKDGYVLDGIIISTGTLPKRGQSYFAAFIAQELEGVNVKDQLLGDYLYGLHTPALGHIVEPGPEGGAGFLSWPTTFTDIAGNVASAFDTLGSTNAIRIFRGFLLLYDASADAATRTVAVRLRKPGAMGLPTGFATAANSVPWNSPTLTLTASEEGALYVADKGGQGSSLVSVNDNGTLSVSDNTTAPHPFPYLAIESDTGILETNIGSGNANDRYSFYPLIEEWLVI